MEFALYYDETYPAPWLERHGKALREHLEKRGFKSLNATELESWMRQNIEQKTSHQTSVVFCQDALPDTILPDGIDCAHALVRRYLDEGGRVVWLGDSPSWYRAHKLSSENPLFDLSGLGVPWAVLGVTPLIADSSSLCRWTDELKRQMKSHWYSMRPVNIEKARDFQGLRIIPLAYAEVTLLPCSYNMLMISRWKKAGKKVAQVSAQVGVGGLGLGGGLSLTEAFPSELGISKPLTLACAWHIRFNEDYPTQGFYRFLDTQVEQIDSKILDDVEHLARLGTSRDRS